MVTTALLERRLRGEFSDAGPDVVRAAIEGASARLRGARVEAFVPLLVERYARDAFRARHPRRPGTGGCRSAPRSGVVYVVRHGLAGDKARWTAPDADRPLDATGRLQADDLVGRFEGRPLRGLVASPTRRCIDTLVPLARRRGRPVAVDAGLAVTAGATGDLAGRLLTGQVDEMVLCTHGEVMLPLLQRLRADGVRVVADADEEDWLLAKGGVWAIEHRGGRPLTLVHAAPGHDWASVGAPV